MAQNRSLRVYGLLMLSLTVVYYALPGWHMLTWSAIGLTGAGAVAVGIWQHRPRRWGFWALLAVALVLQVSGDTTYNVLVQFLGEHNPFPSPADVVYLAMYAVLAVGLTGFIRYSSGGRDRGSMLDALTVTAGLGLLSWIFLINPYVRDTSLTALEKITSIAYPLGDVLILLTITRLLGGVRRNRSTDLLTLGTVGLLVADVLYGLSQLAGSWSVGGPVDLGWVVFYGAFGAAALHPSMARLTAPAGQARTEHVSRNRLVLLAGSSLIAPSALLIESLRTRPYDLSVIAGLSAVTFLLVLTRFAGMVTSHRQAVARERALRRAAAVLLSATDEAKVRDGLTWAVRRLMRPGVPQRMVLVTRDQDPLLPSFPAERAPGARLVAAGTLGEQARTWAESFPVVLMAPLLVEDRPGGDPYLGMVVLAAEERELRALFGAVEVLASQAALALERIALTDEVNRRNSEAYFRTLVHNTSDVILIVDADDRIRYASPSVETVLGHASLAGVPLARVVHPSCLDVVMEFLARVRAGMAPGGVADWSAQHANGARVQVEATCRDLRAEPTVRGLVLTLRDVTAQRKLEGELTHRAFHDALTGLANRTLFQDRVAHAMKRQAGGPAHAGVLFIDLDDFKVVNDTMGHVAGDELLVAVAQRLRTALRPQDTAARLGGDEFAALIEDVTDPTEIERIAERVVEACGRPFAVGAEAAPVNGTASVGIAFSVEAVDATDLLRQADLALYVAKADGKAQWRRYQPAFHEAIHERVEIRNALEQAVHNDEFTLHYQPIVSLRSGETAGFEALVRWRHPARGMVPPGEFIQAAEETGLIVPIGAWVLEHALTSLVAWQRLVPADALPYMSVNVSPQQFREPGFLDRVRGVLDRTGAPPGSVLLEITESLLLRNDERVWTDLTALRAMGIRIAIDDFGTGYSSLSYLRHFPIDVLKIDKSFIDDIGSSQQRAVVDAIVRLAETLELQVVAEGIESPAHRDLLAHMGCPLGQGYLFSRPVPFAEAMRYLPGADPLAPPAPATSAGTGERNEFVPLH